MRIETLLRMNAARRPDAPAIVCETAELTWGQLEADANRVANAIGGLGHRQQERVAIVHANCHVIPVSYFGFWKQNLVTVAINPRMTVDEILRILTHSGATAVVAGTDAAVEAARRAPGVRHVVTAGALEGGDLVLEEILADGDPTDPPAVGVGSDLRSLRYTSGTTGAPKGCMATHEQQLASVSNFLAQVDVPRTHATYLSVPMTLGVGAFYLTATAYLGAPLVVRQRFDVDGFARDVLDLGIAHAFLVPTMLIDLEGRVADGLALPDLRLLGYGGAQVSWSLVRSLHERLGCEMYQGLGATEAGGYATLLTPEDHRELLLDETPPPLASVGRAAAYADIAVLDDAGDQVPPGRPGELRIRSASNFSGYWQQPELTRETLVDGWLALGDIAWQDERGFIYLIDRKGGVIRSGSQNVHPAEVEAVLNSHPEVACSAVLGIPDERYGQRVVALVVPVDGQTGEEDVLTHATARLATHKRPREVTFVEGLPFDEGGKLQRSKLPQLLADART